MTNSKFPHAAKPFPVLSVGTRLFLKGRVFLFLEVNLERRTGQH